MIQQMHKLNIGLAAEVWSPTSSVAPMMFSCHGKVTRNHYDTPFGVSNKQLVFIVEKTDSLDELVARIDLADGLVSVVIGTSDGRFVGNGRVTSVTVFDKLMIVNLDILLPRVSFFGSVAALLRKKRPREEQLGHYQAV
jgi:hypothetical protein